MRCPLKTGSYENYQVGGLGQPAGTKTEITGSKPARCIDVVYVQFTVS
jgi:hypothetical protein